MPGRKVIVAAMSQSQPEILRFLILVPHRDTVKILGEYCRLLFKAGFLGAFSFPAAVPLALLSRPCTDGELKEIAHRLRQSTLVGGREGKIQAGPPDLVPFPHIPGGRVFSGFSFFGPGLDLPVPELSLPGLIYPFPALVLTAALAAGDCSLLREYAPPLKAFFFRAAAVANIVIRPLDDGRGASGGDIYSLEWKIGRLSWLPRKKSLEKNHPRPEGWGIP
jgi:hypothetical protein